MESTNHVLIYNETNFKEKKNATLDLLEGKLLTMNTNASLTRFQHHLLIYYRITKLLKFTCRFVDNMQCPAKQIQFEHT